MKLRNRTHCQLNSLLYSQSIERSAVRYVLQKVVFGMERNGVVLCCVVALANAIEELSTNGNGNDSNNDSNNPQGMYWDWRKTILPMSVLCTSLAFGIGHQGEHEINQISGLYVSQSHRSQIYNRLLLSNDRLLLASSTK